MGGNCGITRNFVRYILLPLPNGKKTEEFREEREMKKTHIILIIMIAVFMGILFSTVMDSSESVTFAQAFEKPGKSLKITGILDKTKEIVYEPSVDPNHTSFYMTDKSGVSRMVVLSEPKPQGFENSQEITLHGKANDSVFEAHEMQMKCPSKYNQEKHLIDQVSEK